MPVSGHRLYPRHTPLGREMWDLGLRVNDVVRGTGIGARTLSDYLANRRTIHESNRKLLAEYLDVEPSELIPPEMPHDGTVHIEPPPHPEPLRVRKEARDV